MPNRQQARAKLRRQRQLRSSRAAAQTVAPSLDPFSPTGQDAATDNDPPIERPELSDLGLPERQEHPEHGWRSPIYGDEVEMPLTEELAEAFESGGGDENFELAERIRKLISQGRSSLTVIWRGRYEKFTLAELADGSMSGVLSPDFDVMVTCEELIGDPDEEFRVFPYHLALEEVVGVRSLVREWIFEGGWEPVSYAAVEPGTKVGLDLEEWISWLKARPEPADADLLASAEALLAKRSLVPAVVERTPGARFLPQALVALRVPELSEQPLHAPARATSLEAVLRETELGAEMRQTYERVLRLAAITSSLKQAGVPLGATETGVSLENRGLNR
jgi:hypothetical protein